jgi:Zn-dependent M28 family amino/carboxypeptidase
MVKSIGIVLIAFLPALAQDGSLSAERIRIHTRFLSSDLMEGRGVGVRGGQLATEYIATQFALAGAKPAGDNGTWYQRVPLVGVETAPAAQLSASSAGKTVSFRWLDDWVGNSMEQAAETRFDAEAVFVGHGITAPEFHWDDYKGTDVRGKVLVLFTNEPTSSDPEFFEGRALTYYGRWTYKYEEALRKGAAGVIIIHTTPTAGYGWDVVRGSWGREQSFTRRAPGEPALALASWATRDAGERLLGLAGKSVDELLSSSESRDFRPIPLGIHIKGVLPTKLREQDTRNVAAMVEGSDPKLKSEVVIYSAHWDHLGIGMPVNGDSIYNGAIDNATGCGILLELAHAWAALPQKPRRSVIFLAVTAEEAGLRGSEYYGTHPLVPVSKTALALNYDALYPLGRVKDVVVAGAERTTIWPLVQQIAKRVDLAIKPDPRPEQGTYFRSDHFSFAKAGIPSFSIERGTEFAGHPPEYSQKWFEEFNSKSYHQPSDEFKEDWDFTALRQAAQFGMLIGLDVANQDALPNWRKGDSFHR